MILSGKKKEEYREVKPYWVRRILGDEHAYSDPMPAHKAYFEIPDKTVTFTNGYGDHRPRIVVEIVELQIKEPNPDWCPPGTSGLWFAIGLGEVIETHNL